MDASSAGTLVSTTSDSSYKTGSSQKSQGSNASAMERDYTKDNSASPVDLECFIQAERITKILDEAVYKTKVAVALPRLIREHQTLATILTPTDMDDVVFIYEQYENPLFSASLLNMAALEDLKSVRFLCEGGCAIVIRKDPPVSQAMGDLSLKNHLNPELEHLTYLLHEYPQLKYKVEEIITGLKREYYSKSEKKENFMDLEYLIAFEHFREIMVQKMDTTAAEELSAKLNTRKLEESNKKYIAKVEECQRLITEENDIFEKAMKEKAKTISDLEQELVFTQHDATVRLKKQILDSDRQMVLASRAHVVKLELLKEEEVECTDSYDALLRHHLENEKNQRARRFKVETQLLSWIQKYDNEMGEKQIELDELNDQYDEEFEKCQKLEADLAEQDKEFIPLMAEREEEYHQEMLDKMQKFLIEHAARVIQFAWRNVLANRAEKKKLKKNIKKTQELIAAAERAKEKAEKAALAAARKAAKEAKKKR